MHLYKFEQLQTPFTDAIAQQYMFTAFSYFSTQNYIERMGIHKYKALYSKMNLSV